MPSCIISHTNCQLFSFQRTSRGIAGFFERKLKIRSSWKPKLKPKKKDGTSEPTSPAQDKRSNSKSATSGLPKRSGTEDLATINETFADDSFFQITLTADNSALDSQIGKLNRFLKFFIN